MSTSSLANSDTRAGLMDARAYPHAVDSVRLIETHISEIFLAGEFAYKIKKPIQTPFLDYRSLADRHRLCEAEVALNRRYAQELYLGVVPITLDQDRVTVNGSGQTLEFAVKMRRFPDGALLSEQLRRGELTRELVDQLATSIARFHLTAEQMQPTSDFGSAKLVWSQAEENIQYFEDHPEHTNSAQVVELRKWSQSTYAKLASAFDRRRRSGFVRACHGDLHLANIICWNGEVKPFDGIEFNDALRWIDVLSDAAFVVMDFAVNHHQELGNRFLNAYLEQTADYEDLSILRWYVVYRAMVRAKVAAMRASQSRAGLEQVELSWNESHDYLKLAVELAQPAAKLRLYITHGVSGSGKTVGTQAYVERHAAIRVRSDVERKRIIRGSLYSETATQIVYDRLRSLASAILNSGYAVVLDATFLKRQQRDQMHALADELKAEFTILPFDASREVLQQRIRQRRSRGQDASDADEAVLEQQMANIEPLSDDERAFVQRENS